MLKCLFASEVLAIGTDQKALYRVSRVGQPPTLSQWAQELGRAGRDGKASEATLLVIQGRGAAVDAPMREFMAENLFEHADSAPVQSYQVH